MSISQLERSLVELNAKEFRIKQENLMLLKVNNTTLINGKQETPAVLRSRAFPAIETQMMQKMFPVSSINIYIIII